MNLGGTSLVMDAAGNATSRMRYHPYGQAWTQSAAPATDKLFTGHTRLGARSGMYYAGARFYSADLGRFMSADSIVPGAGDPQALNRYAYVRGNPLRFSDPTGHCLLDMDGPRGCGFHPVSSRPPVRPTPMSGAAPIAPGMAGCQSGGVTYQCGSWTPGPNQSPLAFLAMVASMVPWLGDGNDLVAWASGCSVIEARCGLSDWERTMYLGTALAPFVGGAMVKGVIKNAPDLIRANRARGVAAEEIFGVAGGKQAIRLADGSLRYPDLVDRAAGILGEVKNARYVGGTLQYNQLKDYADYAEDNHLIFVLATREDTNFSPRIWQLIEDRGIVLNTRADLP